jgi:hypothetical protein
LVCSTFAFAPTLNYEKKKIIYFLVSDKIWLTLQCKINTFLNACHMKGFRLRRNPLCVAIINENNKYVEK